MPCLLSAEAKDQASLRLAHKIASGTESHYHLLLAETSPHKDCPVPAAQVHGPLWYLSPLRDVSCPSAAGSTANQNTISGLLSADNS